MPIYWPATTRYVDGESVDVPARQEYVGAVLDLGEMSYRDDSDFYAVVYDAESNSITRVEYDTTRFGGGGSATIDATPETIERAEAALAEHLFTKLVREAAADAETLKKGRRVVAVRGRKVPIGTTGEAFWFGWNHFRPHYARSYSAMREGAEDRVGVRLDNGETYFGERSNWKVVDPEEHMPSFAELREKAARYAKSHGWRQVGAMPALAFV